MAVFRVEKNRNYTVMSNYHLRDQNLSLKSKGLMSMILSLPEGWHYSTRGLAVICKEGVGAISAAVKELEQAGYVKRNQLRGDHGRLADIEYIIYEQPCADSPCSENPRTVNPDTAEPDTDNPCSENPAGINIDITSPEKTKTDIFITDTSNPYQSYPEQPPGYDGMGYEEAREIVKENIEYDCIVSDPKANRERLDEVVDLIAETLCSRKQTLVIAGDEYPAQMVKDKLMKINSMHIEYVFDCLDQNTTYVRNIKKYLLASLFNAPSTMGSYYSALVQHDFYGDGQRGK